MNVAVVIGVIGIILLGLFLYWQLVIAEGAYLGRRVVRLLYDLGASSYDQVKRFNYSDEFSFLAKPLFDRLQRTAGTRARVLDVATGTGRLPMALIDVPHFRGEIVALDISARMLREAAYKVEALDVADRIRLIHHPAVPLPFADETFDAVTMLEALEFLPDRETALREMARVLRPGGWMLVSNRIGLDATLMPGRSDAPDAFEDRLRALGLVNVFTKSWQTYYSLVWARKPGVPTRRNALISWNEALLCPECRAAGTMTVTGSDTERHIMTCTSCATEVRQHEGIWIW